MFMPIPVTARSKASVVFDRSTHGCMSMFCCVDLSCLGRGLAMARSLVQGILQKCLKRFIVSEVNSESEQIRGPKP
jgi:hypothetical protein